MSDVEKLPGDVQLAQALLAAFAGTSLMATYKRSDWRQTVTLWERDCKVGYIEVRETRGRGWRSLSNDYRLRLYASHMPVRYQGRQQKRHRDYLKVEAVVEAALQWARADTDREVLIRNLDATVEAAALRLRTEQREYRATRDQTDPRVVEWLLANVTQLFPQTTVLPAEFGALLDKIREAAAREREAMRAYTEAHEAKVARLAEFDRVSDTLKESA